MFPLPRLSASDRNEIAQAGKAVLEARGLIATMTLAQLYEPGAMTPALNEAHAHLDARVEAVFGIEPRRSSSELERQTVLFRHFDQLQGSFFAPALSARLFWTREQLQPGEDPWRLLRKCSSNGLAGSYVQVGCGYWRERNSRSPWPALVGSLLAVAQLILEWTSSKNLLSIASAPACPSS